MAANLAGPAAIVQDKYNKSVQLADSARAEVTAFNQALTASIYQPPRIDVRWEGVLSPAVTPIPAAPPLPKLQVAVPSDAPSGLSVVMNDVNIDNFDVAAPDMKFMDAPTVLIGEAPALPELRDVPLPDEPDVVLPAAPDFMSLTTHTFDGVNLHEGWLSKLDSIPRLSVLEPAPFSYSPGKRYASQLLDNLKASLNARVHGGTGLSPDVEQQLWDRARDRETQTALAREQEVLRGAEALGFPLPAGALAGQLADARREYHDKLSSLSRDIAIKQAELEQQNVKDAIQSALQLENQLIDENYKFEMLVFESSKAAADNAIAVHNASVENFRALLDGYRAYAGAYDTLVKAEMSKVEVFKALLHAEQTKADINRSLVERYKAEIEGAMASVEVYKARVGAAQTLVELERTRIQAGSEQVRAFVATVNAETAKAEMYKAQIQGESAKGEAYKALVAAYSAKVGAQAEKARVEVAKFQAHVAAKGLEWDGWKARLSAAVSAADIAAKHASITVDGYRAASHAAEAQAGASARLWEAQIKHYEAGQTIAYQTAKYNADAVTHANDARMDAAKVMLTTGSQRLASAWAMVSAAAEIRGSSNDNFNYSM